MALTLEYEADWLWEVMKRFCLQTELKAGVLKPEPAVLCSRSNEIFAEYRKTTEKELESSWRENERVQDKGGERERERGEEVKERIVVLSVATDLLQLCMFTQEVRMNPIPLL